MKLSNSNLTPAQSAITTIGMVVLAILLIITGPLVTIWALDTLFSSLKIPYTWQTWFAVFWLGMLFTGNYRNGKSNSK
jgi:hypothetical protein